APLNSEASSSASERPLAEIISEKFLPFDSTTYIINPFSAEAARDVMLEEEYTTMLLEAILQTHAWATSRFKRKAQLECQELENQNHTIINMEREQGMCSPTPSSSISASSLSSSARESLANFVTQMKKALAALTGV
ncbi:hypothetical protein BYT27DRAFT_7058753, partial [Phlegmacium glaucopus]